MPAKRRRTTKDYDRIDFRGLRDLRAVTINPETEKPFKQGEIAAKAEIQQQTYSKIELGDTYNPSREIVQKIAAAFSRSYTELLNAMPVREARKQEFARQYIANYSQPYSPRGFEYDDGVLKNKANQIEEPHFLRNCNGYAVTVPSDTLLPRYKQGDILFVNPEIEPERGDDVCIQLAYKDRTICIVREVIDKQPYNSPVGAKAWTYGTIQPYMKDYYLRKNFTEQNFNDWIEETQILLPSCEGFLAGDDEEEEVLDEHELEYWKDWEPDPAMPVDIRIHTVVGSQKHRSPRDRSHMFVEVKHPLEMEAKVGQVTVNTTNASDT
jgi:transcriptional regulator with XRE-family HTH domain